MWLLENLKQWLVCNVILLDSTELEYEVWVWSPGFWSLHYSTHRLRTEVCYAPLLRGWSMEWPQKFPGISDLSSSSAGVFSKTLFYPEWPFGCHALSANLSWLNFYLTEQKLPSSSFLHQFIQQRLLEFLICARCCSRSWGYNSEPNRQQLLSFWSFYSVGGGKNKRNL